jgi:hypothetical protein
LVTGRTGLPDLRDWDYFLLEISLSSCLALSKLFLKRYRIYEQKELTKAFSTIGKTASSAGLHDSTSAVLSLYSKSP